MRRFSLVAAIGILGVAATTYAAGGKAPEAWASGRLDRFDPTAKLVVVKQGTHEMTFSLEPGAQLMLGRKSLQPSDLTGDIGREVKIRYTLSGSTKVADRIEVGNSVAAHTASAPTKK
jgi:hypothetical protein